LIALESDEARRFIIDWIDRADMNKITKDRKCVWRNGCPTTLAPIAAAVAAPRAQYREHGKQLRAAKKVHADLAMRPGKMATEDRKESHVATLSDPRARFHRRRADTPKNGT
jgi:hypothetical protein